MEKIKRFFGDLAACVSFSLRNIILFVRYGVKLLCVIGVVVAILNGPGFAQSSRDGLNANLDNALSNCWKDKEVLNVYFPADESLLYNESDIKGRVKKEVDAWNERVRNDLARKRDGFVVDKDLPLHYVRAFYYNSRIYLLSDNVVGIPEVILRNEIK